MTLMSTLPLQISTQPPAADAASATGQRGAEEAGSFPQLLATQRTAHQATAPEIRGRDARNAADSAADDEAAANDAALQLLAVLFPGAAAQITDPQALDGVLDSEGKPLVDAKPSPAHAAQTDLEPALAPALTALLDRPVSQDTALEDAESVLQTVQASVTDTRGAPGASKEAAGLALAKGGDARQHTQDPAVGLSKALATPRAVGQPVPALDPETSLAPSSTQGSPISHASDLALGVLATSQSASIASPSATAPAALSNTSLFIPAPLGHPGWNQAMAQQLGHALKNNATGIQHAELRLDPPDLGPLRVTLQIQDNVAHAWFVSPHASVRQAVESALPHLAQQLADAGLSLGGTHVGSEQADGYQQTAQFFAQQASKGAASRAQNDTELLDVVLSPSASSGSNPLVDTYA